MSRTLSTQLQSLHSLCWVAFMAALIATGAFLHLQIGPVPISFQDMFIVLAGLALGPKHGLFAMALYVLAGCAGLPVFSGGRAGLGHAIGPTGGYLFGFFFLVWFAGMGGRAALAFMRRRSAQGAAAPGLSALAVALLWMLPGYVFVFSFGPAWLAFTMKLSLGQTLALGLVPFLPLTPLKMALCLVLWRTLVSRGLLPQ